MYRVPLMGLTPEELEEQVTGIVWARWIATEPTLASLPDLNAMQRLTGNAKDAPLGGLVRLAAIDGGDDPLAAIAVSHQLEWGARHLMHSLHDLTEDIDEVVLGTLWIRIRTFPWRRRTHAYAANLLRDTRASVLASFGRRTSRPGPRASVLIDPQSALLDRLTATQPSVIGAPTSSAQDPSDELAELLHWALTCGVIGRDDAVLLLDLVEAGEEVADKDTPWTMRGMCSQAAVRRVAERRGVSGKTVMRERDRVVAALRGSAERYVQDAA